MRPIKFRAWDKRLMMMSSVSIIEWDKMAPETPIYIRGRIISHIEPDLLKRGLYQEWQTGGETETLEAVKVEDVVLMQFTGLHDKNGKEIFEGDVLRPTAETWIGFVVYNAPRFQVHIVNHAFDMLVPSAVQYYEVLGNIYENPELLSRTSSKDSK